MSSESARFAPCRTDRPVHSLNAKRAQSGFFQLMDVEPDPDSLALERYRLAFEITPMPLVLVRRDGSIALSNAEFEALFDIESGEGPGLQIEDFVPAASQSAHSRLRSAYAGAAVRRQMGTGRDLYGVTLKGRHIPVEIGLHPVRVGHDMWTLASVVDISERRRIDQALQASNHQLQTVLDAATNGIVGMAPDRQIRIINPTAQNMLDGAAADLPCAWPEGIRFLEPRDMHPLDREQDPITRALQGKRLEGEIYVLSDQENAMPRYVRVSSAPVARQDSPIQVVIVLDDVTEMETNRQQVERSSRLDALGQLTGGIAHDFNNLLATILYGIELIEMYPHNDRIQRILNTTKDSVSRGTALTRRMLAFAKRQPGLEASRQVRDVFADLQALAKPTIGEDIAFEVVPPERELYVFCDPAQLDNALLNLVLNARDAIRSTGRAGRIILRASALEDQAFYEQMLRETPGTFVARGRPRACPENVERDASRTCRYVVLSVTDDGPGMSKEVRQRAIDPFFTTKHEGAGTGLGLSMVYGFVQQSDGEMRIYSERGNGTSVHLTLRRGTEEGAREAPVRRSVRQTGAGERILVVEDEENLLQALLELLDILGYRTVSASNGRDALKLAEGGAEFDLLLSDVVMPGGIGGFELARQLRAARPDLKVVYMSGYTGFTEEEMGEHVAPLLAKPCPPEVLATTLRQVLDGTHPSPSFTELPRNHGS